MGLDHAYQEDIITLKKYHSYLLPLFFVAVIFSLTLFAGKIDSSTSATVITGAETRGEIHNRRIPVQETAPVQPPLTDPKLNATATPNRQGKSLPILMYHEITDGPSSLYVTADNFRAQMLYLRDNGFNVITMTQAQALLAQDQIPAKTVVITFDDGYVSVFNNAWPVLQALNFPATVYVISSFPGLYNYLTWDQIKIMHSGGIEIGSHTKTHPALTTVSSAQLTDEIAGSKQVLEEQLGVPIYSFCYPTGAFNQYTPPAVKDAGYTSAVTIVSRSATTQDNSFLIPRIRVSKGTSVSNFAKLLN